MERTLLQFEEMIDRLAGCGLDTSVERRECGELRRRVSESRAGDPSDALYLAARQARRRLFFRDPRLAPLEHILFAKRHPFKPSHNYSEHFDSLFASGGGLFILDIPRDGDGRLDPARGRERCIFDGRNGIVRDPVAGFDGRTITFAYRPDEPEVDGWQSYWHLWSVDANGGGLRRLTDGPFHDFDPVPLPDGGLGFTSTRCKVRFLCWRPQAYVLHRMEADGSNIRPLSYANVSEWDPALMRDGRILWTRSEYQDKGADFGHTLWAIHPDGTHPELIFGNDTPYGYGHGREMPGSGEIVCTLISHGDLQGPIALIDPARGLYNTAAITSITPDTRPQYQMDRSHHETFRDPEPVSPDHILVSHNPGTRDHWALYVIDRYGNRELLYLDPSISSKSPTPLRARPSPPLLPSNPDPRLAAAGLGQFTVQDVYEGLGPTVPRGRVKYLQVSQEVPPRLEALPCGEFRSDHPPFQNFYATPVHRVHGPAHTVSTRSDNALRPHAFRAGGAVAAEDGLVQVTERGGWPSYVAKAVLGTVPVADDGSASFTAPAGRVLYFHLLDGDFNELQRMRSVVQLQPGERRGCVGCHDDRLASPPRRIARALTEPARAARSPGVGRGALRFRPCRAAGTGRSLCGLPRRPQGRGDRPARPARRQPRPRVLPRACRRRLGGPFRLDLRRPAFQSRASHLRSPEEPSVCGAGRPRPPHREPDARRTACDQGLDRPELPPLARLSLPQRPDLQVSQPPFRNIRATRSPASLGGSRKVFSAARMPAEMRRNPKPVGTARGKKPFGDKSCFIAAFNPQAGSDGAHLQNLLLEAMRQIAAEGQMHEIIKFPEEPLLSPNCVVVQRLILGEGAAKRMSRSAPSACSNV
ncbi:MAG: hypothetical protein U1G05_19705 [Kiritimatiellia bacterium]